MNDKPANRHRDLRSLIRDDAYAASFQSLGQYRTALLELAAPAVQGEPVVDMPTLPSEQTKLQRLWLEDNAAAERCYHENLSAGLNPRRWYTYAERIESAGGRVRADGMIEFDTADAVDRLVRAIVRDCYLAHDAPAVQGEPIATIESAYSGDPDTRGTKRVVAIDRHRVNQLEIGTELYATPQQPACASQPDKSDSQAALSAESEKQAPDVAGLTEALRQYQHNDGSGFVFAYDRILVDQYVAGLVEALEDVVSEIESNTCPHDNTYRGGAIWEICEDCGEKWADDMGGKPEFVWPESVETARNLIAAHRKGAPKMATNKPKTVWWVEPNHMPGVHKIRASVYMSGHTVEVSRLVPQTQLDSAIEPLLLVGQIIFSMQSALNGVITGSANNGNQ